MTLIALYMWKWMFESDVIVMEGKQRSDIYAMYTMEPSLCHVQLWLQMRASAGFSEGALRLIALGLVARSAGGPTFCPCWGGITCLFNTSQLTSQPNYPPISHFLKRELLQIMPVVGGYIAFQASTANIPTYWCESILRVFWWYINFS